MSRGGARTGSGRKKGAIPKKTVAYMHKVASEGLTPVEYMLQVMRDPQVGNSRRDDMAKAVAPYTNSKMPTAIVTPPPAGSQPGPDDEGILKQYLDGLHDEANEE